MLRLQKKVWVKEGGKHRLGGQKDLPQKGRNENMSAFKRRTM